MIQKILPSHGKVLIIDDKAEDVVKIQNILAQNGISYIFYDYSLLKEVDVKKADAIRMIFLDIRLEDGIQGVKNIGTVLASTIEKVVDCENGPYSIVLWTNEIQLKDEIQEYLMTNLSKEETTLPTYICAVDKKQFELQADDILEEELDLQLSEQQMMNFLIEWENDTMKISSNILRLLLYGLNAELDNDSIEKILLQLASLLNSNVDSEEVATKNILYSLSELVRDRYLEIVSDDKIISKLSNHWSTDFACIDIKEIQKNTPVEQKASLNTFLNVNTYDTVDIQLPGKVVEVNEPDLPFNTDDFKNSTLSKLSDEKKIKFAENEIDLSIKPVELDITPNCDYAQNKNYMLRTVFGYKIGIIPEINDGFPKWVNGSYLKKISSKIQYDYVYITPELFINGELCLFVFNTKYMYLAEKNFYLNHNYLCRFNNDILCEIRKKSAEIISRIGINNV